MLGTKRLTSIGAIFLTLSCSGCFYSGAQSSSISIPAQWGEWRLHKIASTPTVYQVTPSKGEDAKLYLTAVNSCGRKPKGWRQLFVGLREIRVVKQETHPEGVALNIVNAQLDEVPIRLAAITRPDGGCLSDYVMWSPAQEVNESEFDGYVQQFERIYSESVS